METIERTQPVSRVKSLFDAPPSVRSERRWPYRLWRGALAFLATAAVAFALSGLIALRDRLSDGWKSAYSDFRWTILVTGDQVELDEIGRYLNQVDGIDQATFLPAAAIMDRLRNEPLLADHLSVLDPAKLPALWQVTWTPAFDLNAIDETIADLRRLPGVDEIAFEQRELDKIRFFRAAWFKTRIVLAGLAVIGSLLGAILLGRFLFFTNLKMLRPAPVAETVVLAIVAWMAGLCMARGLVGPFSWHLAWGGLVAGLARICAAHTRRLE